jgi:hypothetical protein
MTLHAVGVRELFNDAYGETTAHNLHTSGRIMLNIWRAMQTELKLNIYNAEACFAAVLQLRIPEVPPYVVSGACQLFASHFAHGLKGSLFDWAAFETEVPQCCQMVNHLGLSSVGT